MFESRIVRIRRLLRTARQAGMSGFLAAAMLCCPTGCSFFVGSKQTVTLEASDPAARLFVNGREVGTGRATVSLARNDTHTARAELPDGRVAGGKIRRSVSTAGVMDVVGGLFFLVPFVGVLAPGFWHLDPDYLYMRIPPAAGGGDGGAATGAGPAQPIATSPAR